MVSTIPASTVMVVARSEVVEGIALCLMVVFLPFWSLRRRSPVLLRSVAHLLSLSQNEISILYDPFLALPFYCLLQYFLSSGGQLFFQLTQIRHIRSPRYVTLLIPMLPVVEI